jgi:apolipoprotein N-acyltransferase
MNEKLSLPCGVWVKRDALLTALPPNLWKKAALLTVYKLMKPVLRDLSAILLSLLGGVLVALAFPPWNYDWLIWIGFTPVLAGLLLFPRRWATSLIQGAVFGGTFGGLVFSWLLSGQRPGDWASNVVSLALVGGIWGIFVHLFVRLPAKSGDRKVSPILPGYGFNAEAWTNSMAHLRAAFLTAAAWTVLEWTRGVLLPEWNAVGLVMQSNLPLLQLSTVTGVSGLSFVVVFANLIALTTVRRIILEPGRMTWASRFDVTATLGVIFLAGIGGFWWLQQKPAGDRKNIRLVCPDTVDFNRLLELSGQEKGKGIDLFVWRCAKFDPGDYKLLADSQMDKTAGLVSGTTSVENGPLSGSTIFVPGAIRNYFLIPSRHDFFQPGGGAVGRTLNPFTFADTSWVTMINWDAGDPRLVRAAVTKQIQVIIALVDPFPGGPGATEQLFANLRIWAVSLGHPVIFASAKSFAAIVARSGKIVAGARVTPGADASTGIIEVPSPFDSTPYGRYGDWFAVACGAACLVTAISERLNRHHEKSGRFRS